MVKKVAEFYEDAKAKAMVVREVNDENFIWKLFDDSGTNRNPRLIL